jgi:hypothetical protein
MDLSDAASVLGGSHEVRAYSSLKLAQLGYNILNSGAPGRNALYGAVSKLCIFEAHRLLWLASCVWNSGLLVRP